MRSRLVPNTSAISSSVIDRSAALERVFGLALSKLDKDSGMYCLGILRAYSVRMVSQLLHSLTLLLPECFAG